MALASGYKSRPPIRAADMAASQTRRRSGFRCAPVRGPRYAEPNAIGYPKFFSRSHRAGSCEPSLATLAAQFAPQRSDAESSQTEQRKC